MNRRPPFNWSANTVKRTAAIRHFRSSREPDAANRVDAFFRHPFVLLVAGFVLTAVVGSSLSYWRETRDHQIEQARREQADARTAIDQMARLFAEFGQRAKLVLRGAQGQIPESEEIERKRAYDEALVKAETSTSANAGVLNRAFPIVHPQAPTASGQYGALAEAIGAVDACVELVYESSQKQAKGVPLKFCPKKPPVFPVDIAASEAVSTLDRCAAVMFRTMSEVIESQFLSDPARSDVLNLEIHNSESAAGCPLGLIDANFETEPKQ